MLCHLSSDIPPKVVYTVYLTSDLKVSVYFENCKLTNIGKYNIIDLIATIDEFQDILEKLENFHDHYQMESKSNIELAMQLIKSCTDFENAENLKFVHEQLDLYVKAMPKYSSDLLIFSSLFHNCSPAAYNFVRNYGNVKLPSHTTIKRLNASYCGFSDNFLSYVKTNPPHYKKMIN